jgi:hypothetical protein
VVFRLRCPNRIWIVPRSVPDSSRCVREAVTKGMGRDLLGNSGVADGVVKHHKDVVAADGLAGVSPGKSHSLGLYCRQ